MMMMVQTEKKTKSSSSTTSNSPLVPAEFCCPITHALMRDPVRAADGHVYEKLAIERWYAQRTTSPMTGAPVESTAVVPEEALRQEIEKVATALRDTEDGAHYFSCPYCSKPDCQGAGCRQRYERQLRSDAAFGAAARRRRWIEGTLLPSAERVLRSGPVAAGALMVGAFSVGAVGAILGGLASSVAEVLSGGLELAQGLADSLSRTADDDDDAVERPSWSRGCFKIASGAVLVPVASASIAAVFAIGVAAGGLALATGVVNELANAAVRTARLTSDVLLAGSSSPSAAAN